MMYQGEVLPEVAGEFLLFPALDTLCLKRFIIELRCTVLTSSLSSKSYFLAMVFAVCSSHHAFSVASASASASNLSIMSLMSPLTLAKTSLLFRPP